MKLRSSSMEFPGAGSSDFCVLPLADLIVVVVELAFAMVRFGAQLEEAACYRCTASHENQ